MREVGRERRGESKVRQALPHMLAIALGHEG